MLSNLDDADATATSLIDAYVNGTPICNTVNGMRRAYNPLVWWRLQHDLKYAPRLTFLRLSSSVDVERAFLFAGSIVSKRRHNLAPYTIQATASLGSYSKAGLVKSSILELLRTAKAKAKAKSRVAVLALNAADAV
ncbi:hypothetical protein BDV93DRAFT_564873 [Ceratobasidium sp. AG-I]|nr:hypothetical protein BDV93DRAFT_564873 [Ceratobasidium sp. AG-I]